MYIHTCMHLHIYVYLYTYAYRYMNTYLRTYISIYIRIYIQNVRTYIHNHIHIFIYKYSYVLSIHIYTLQAFLEWPPGVCWLLGELGWICICIYVCTYIHACIITNRASDRYSEHSKREYHEPHKDSWD